jgi:hypothetical protein
VCLMPAGASSATSIVGAMSTRYGVVVKGVTAGPAATITPSMRWSPLTQSASSIADFACALTLIIAVRVSVSNGADHSSRQGASRRR